MDIGSVKVILMDFWNYIQQFSIKQLLQELLEGLIDPTLRQHITNAWNSLNSGDVEEQARLWGLAAGAAVALGAILAITRGGGKLLKVLKKISPNLGGMLDKKVALTTPDGRKVVVSEKDLLGDGKENRMLMKKDGDGYKNTHNNPDEPFKHGYEFKKGIDQDWRKFPDRTVDDALEFAFNRVEKVTGVKKVDMQITQWGKDEYGKSVPVEWQGIDANGIMVEVNADYNHTTHKTLNAPHVGYKFGKRDTKEVGHIILNSVPAGRINKK